MTRTILGKQVLESGPLTAKQFRSEVGWPTRQAERTLQNLVEAGVAERFTKPGITRYVYRLAA